MKRQVDTISFVHEDSGIAFELNHEQILAARNALRMDWESFAEMLTGLNADSYADTAEGLAIEGGGDPVCAREYDEETYDRCFAYYRVLNGDLIYEEVVANWITNLRASGG